MTLKLHFSLGPVQGFVAQARRTRDFWAGSFLLSWLSGQAMNEVLQNDGSIVFPEVKDDELMQAIKNHSRNNSLHIATLPNRFMALIPEEFDPNQCVKAIKLSWQKIAEAVYEEYVRPVEGLGNDTRAIWKRQIDGFWDINWVIGEDNSLLDRRKNWRTHIPTIELGDKCMLMGNLQEFSGYVRSYNRDQQDIFWKALAEKCQNQLRDNERLCAVAFVKRMFPLVAERAIGYKVEKSYPSTTSLALAHWQVKMMEECPDLCRKFAGSAKPLGFSGERKVKVIQEAVKRTEDLEQFVDLDSNCFFEATLENDNLWQDKARASGDLRRELQKILRDFPENPTPYYAVLLMDGDKMGELLSTYPDKVNAISQALGRFSTLVPQIIHEHNGVCVYAGGDDVFALLPLEDALAAARNLRKKYSEAFAEVCKSEDIVRRATLSGAIVFAHHHAPLQVIIREAHRTLDDVAKDGTGRDSLAVNVWKTVGSTLCWSAPWQVVGLEGSILDELVQEFSGTSRQYTSSFFYNLRRRFEALYNENKLLQDEEQVKKLLLAEYLRIRDLKNKNESDEEFYRRAEANISKLLKLCKRFWRDEDGKCHPGDGEISELKLDGALLVKFLASKGVEK